MFIILPYFQVPFDLESSNSPRIGPKESAPSVLLIIMSNIVGFLLTQQSHQLRPMSMIILLLCCNIAAPPLLSDFLLNGS